MELVNPKILEFYFQCKMKAYLTLTSNQIYKPTPYESTLRNLEVKTMRYFFKKNSATNYSQGVLEKGYEIISNVKIAIGDSDFECNLFNVDFFEYNLTTLKLHSLR